MSTDAKREGNARHHDSLKAVGKAKKTFWLEPDTIVALERLKAVYGSNDKAVNAAILALSHAR